MNLIFIDIIRYICVTSEHTFGQIITTFWTRFTNQKYQIPTAGSPVVLSEVSCLSFYHSSAISWLSKLATEVSTDTHSGHNYFHCLPYIDNRNNTEGKHSRILRFLNSDDNKTIHFNASTTTRAKNTQTDAQERVRINGHIHKHWYTVRV